jgi:hypothetical protein
VNIRRISLTKTSDLADTLALQLRALHLPIPDREACLVPGRKFRSDLSWPALKICCEVDGGDRMLGRHGRASGMASDCEKQNLLVLAGWTCYRFTGSQVKSGAAIAWLERVLR